MKVGDLVQPLDSEFVSDTERCWNGIIIDWEGVDPIVFWSEKFPAEVEYKEQIKVINEGR
ncbi:MAG: hypothetical protein H8E12_08965 [Rhodobacteraceae bacterium]|nr:hypothetical protein [Paracoccaceae bacterium]